jgi:hypothetical protein
MGHWSNLIFDRRAAARADGLANRECAFDPSFEEGLGVRWYQPVRTATAPTSLCTDGKRHHTDPGDRLLCTLCGRYVPFDVSP